MDKEQALKTLIAYAICNVETGDLRCTECPFYGELIKKDNRSLLQCVVNSMVTDDKVIESVRILNEGARV